MIPLFLILRSNVTNKENVTADIQINIETQPLCNNFAPASSVSTSLFVQRLSPWKQIRSISPRREDCLLEFLRKGIKENLRLMKENESHYLSI